MHAPYTTHLHIVMHIVYYLQGTLEHGLWLRHTISHTLIVPYSDVDWAGCKDYGRSTTGYAIFCSLNLVAWCSKKEPTISTSNTKDEYRAIGYTVAETIQICKLLYDPDVSLHTLVRLYYDNLSSTYMFTNPLQCGCSKHIVMDYHFDRELVAEGDSIIHYVPKMLQTVDILTKGISPQKFFITQTKSISSPRDQIEGEQ